MSQPLISIITPCYNAGKFLVDAVESVLAQTYNNFEWIIVNDGSTDETEAILSKYHDNRIQYYHQENKGQCSASNFGLKKAVGDYIKFFDADDVMNPKHLEEQIERMDGSKNILVSCAWGRFYDGDFRSTRFIPETVWQDMDSLSWIKASLSQKYDMMGAWIWLIPKEVILKVGGWDERLSLNNDFEFTMRLLKNVTEVRFASKALIYYRTNSNTLSQLKSYRALNEAILSTDLGLGYLLEMENNTMTRRLCADRYQEWVFRIFPQYPKLVKELEIKINYFGGSSRSLDGGRVLKVCTIIFGWKFAKLLKSMFQSFGYRRLPNFSFLLWLQKKYFNVKSKY
jgi:glycosyltransferase involved in cell wall biosynthesis